MQFWKLLLNLCSRRWLRPKRSRVVNLTPLWLQQLKQLLVVGLINLRISLLKIPKLLAFQMVGSSLFHSMIADGKKVFFKNLRLSLLSGIPWTFLVATGDIFFLYYLKYLIHHQLLSKILYIKWILVFVERTNWELDHMKSNTITKVGSYKGFLNCY